MRVAGLFSTVRQGVGPCALALFLFAPLAVQAADPALHQPASAGAPAAHEANADIYGVWRLSKVLDSADVAAMSDRQAKAMIGKEVLIAKNRFTIDGRTCKRPTYRRSVDDLAKSFREKGHVSSVNMGLPDAVTSIDARCTHIYLKAPGRIVVHWDGF